MKAIITVTGKDAVGIVAKISEKCRTNNVNIVDITQKIMNDLFVMIMVVELDKMYIKFTDFVDQMDGLGKQEGLVIHTMHEDIFNSMHRI